MPESEAAIENIRKFESLAAVRDGFIRSQEFATYYERETGLSSTQVFYSEKSTYRPPMKHPGQRIALGAIVKNEEETIVRMVESCKHIVDYVVIGDTGSSDATMRVVSAYLQGLGLPHKVVSIPFVDFAQARNAVMDQADPSCNWFLMLDGDEHFVDEDLQGLLDLTAVSEIDGWHLPRYNFPDFDKAGPVSPYPDYQQRLFRLKPDRSVRYVRPVHEQVDGIRSWGQAARNTLCVGGTAGGPHIHHMGHCVAPVGSQRFEEKVRLYNELEPKGAS